MAYIGVELPCRRRIPAQSCALVLVDGVPVHLGAPKAGSLCATHRVARQVEALVQEHLERIQAEAAQLHHHDPTAAELLLQRTATWAMAVRTKHYSPHRRPTFGDRFRAYDIPQLIHRMLLLQVLEQQPAHMPLVQVCLVAPVLPCMRLLDKVSVYLHIPQPARHPSTTGRWWTLPESHVQAELVGHHVVVVAGQSPLSVSS